MRNPAVDKKDKLLGSLLLFTQVFYELRTGRPFELSTPDSRESHFITVAKALTRVFRSDCSRLIINIPPRYGKTEMLIHFVAWALAHFGDANFLYVSYSRSLAKKQTQTIKEIISHPEYKLLFGVSIKDDVSAKDNFETVQNGSVYASGSEGTITGRGAGIQNCLRFGGAIIIDDIHKPSEVTSDTMRKSVNDWYLNTLQSRVNSPTTPIIFIGQRLHEDDLAANLMNSFDGKQWESVCLPALDSNDNALHPKMHDRMTLLSMRENMPYEFSAQYQQDPQPAGGGIFKPEWFVLMDEEPPIEFTFIVGDTAETIKDYSDYTVFSFFGLYRPVIRNVAIDIYALHWIDCYEFKAEPKDLENEFMQFWADCMRHPIKPKVAAIEKKSTGSTLVSVAKNIQGLQIYEIDRTRETGNKTNRFLKVQPYVAARQVSLPRYGKHTHGCIEHMRKITANNSHRHDDRADTLADGIDLSLIRKVLTPRISPSEKLIVNTFNNAQHRLKEARIKSWYK